jgi:hypothetical protein
VPNSKAPVVLQLPALEISATHLMKQEKKRTCGESFG